jgi:hypothetical protein
MTPRGRAGASEPPCAGRNAACERAAAEEGDEESNGKEDEGRRVIRQSADRKEEAEESIRVLSTQPIAADIRDMPIRRLPVLLSLLACIGAATAADAQQFVATGRDTLRGLPGVEVLVEGIDPELQRAGIDAVALRAAVERQLRAGGVPVFRSQSENPSAAKPYVYVLVSGFGLEARGYVAGVQVHLRQTLRSAVTGSNVINAMTWDQHSVVFVPAGGAQVLRDEVQTAVDTFVKDWQAVH